jgi:hypothetical protein
VGLNVYLESQKQNIATSVAIQNAMKKRNPGLSDNADFTDSFVSIFSAQIRTEIRDKAEQFNNISNQVGFKNEKNQIEAINSCNEVNGKVADLKSLLSWAGSASQEIASIPGLSNSAASTVKQAMSETMQFAASTINNSISLANEALSKIKVIPDNQNEQTVGTKQNNFNNFEQNTSQGTDFTSQDLSINTQNVSDATLTKVDTTAKTDTGLTVNNDIKPAVDSVKTDVAKDVQPVKLDIKS